MISELVPYANRLRFPREMENLFDDDYYTKSISTTRLALLLGIVLVTAFSLLDFLAAPAALPIIWAIRFGVICPVFGLVLFLTSRPLFRRWMQPLLSLAVLVGGLGIAAMSAVAQPSEAAYTTYYAGLILVIMWGYTFIRLRFWYATLTGWIIVAGYQVVAIGYQHLLTAPMGMEVFVNNNFFFVTANILGMCAAYFIERYARLDFLQRRVIEDDKAKLEQSLQKEAADALRESEARFRTLVEISVNGVIIIDADTHLAYVSPAFEQMTGYAAGELVGRSFFPLIHPDDLPPIRATFAGLIEQRESRVKVEYRSLRKDGGVRVFEGAGQLLPNGQVVGFIRDITERRQLEDDLRRLNEKLEDRVAERTTQLEAAFAERTRLAEILEATTDLVAFATLDGQALYLNRAGRRMLGLADDVDPTTLSFADFYPPDVMEHFATVGIPTALREGAWAEEVTLKHQDGHLIPVSIVGILHRAPDGTPSHLSAIIRDISERKQAEEERQAALTDSRRLATIIEAMPDYVGIADAQGWSLYVNKAGRQLVGKPEKDETPWNVAHCYPPEEMPRLQGMFDAMAHGRTWAGESVLRHLNGSTIPVEQTVFPLHDTTGNIESYAAVIRDISERKQADEELRRRAEENARLYGEAQQAKEIAETANIAKSTFLANMSHEIRTPMNAVIGMTGLLLNTPLNDKQRDFVEIIRTSGDALLTIINDILDFSKIEAGKMDLVNRPFDLRGCIESVLDLLAPKAAEKRLDLVYDMGPDVPPGLSGDDTRLRQILVNLVGNAVKFTEQGEVVVEVKLEKPKDSLIDPETPSSTPLLPTPYSLLHFTVRDTGIGIPADKLDRLFQSFTQLDPSTTRHYGGTGLGLAISQRLAELMGGAMWAESKGAGQGTIFHFTLTAQAAPVPARHHLSHPRPELSGKRVLIVDDNATNRRILNLQLQNWGMLAQEAATPAEALAAIRRGDAFDLALLDMNMPEMDGATLATEICFWHSPHHFPLVMLTSLGYQTHPALEALECFAAYLTKPVKPSQLYDTLVNVFAEEEAHDQLAPSQSQSPMTNLPSPVSNLPISSSPYLLSTQYPLRILLAEDVQVNQKFALLALEEIGYRADVAANGLEVLAAVLRQPYDVILMDVQMPEMDGLEATQRIHDIWANQALRGFNGLNGAGDDGLPTTNRPYIIAMTANALQGDREICLAAGMDDYISKPVYLEELRLVLKRAGRRRSVAEPSLPDGVSLPEPASTPVTSGQNSNGPIDQAVLDKLLIRPSGRKLISGYLSEAADMVSVLRNAVAENDAQTVREVAHNLKGSSSYVGLTGVAGLSSELEQQGRRGLIHNAAATVAQLVEAFEQTRQLLHERLDASTALEGVMSQK